MNVMIIQHMLDNGYKYIVCTVCIRIVENKMVFGTHLWGYWETITELQLELCRALDPSH